MEAAAGTCAARFRELVVGANSGAAQSRLLAPPPPFELTQRWADPEKAAEMAEGEEESGRKGEEEGVGGREKKGETKETKRKKRKGDSEAEGGNERRNRRKREKKKAKRT